MVTRTFLRLLPVQIMLVAVASLNSMIDGLVASNCIGPLAMEAIGFYAPIIKLIETVGAVMLGGSQILCGQFFGKNQVRRTSGLFSVNLMTVSAFSVLLMGLCLVLPEKLAALLGARDEAAAGLTDYIRGIAPGFVAQALCAQLPAFLQLEHEDRRAFVAIIVMGAVNGAADLLFVNRLGLGMFGLGLATTIANWVMCAILAAYYLGKKASIRFAVAEIHWADLRQIVSIGIPGAVSVFCLALRAVVVNYLLANYGGEGAMPAWAAFNSFGYLFFSITSSVGSATRMLCSVYIGENDRTSLIQTMRAALFQGVGLVCVFAAFIVDAAVPFTRLFYRDPSAPVYHLTLWLFRLFPFSMPLSAIFVVMQNYLQSFGRIRVVNVLSVFDGLLGTLIVGVVLTPLYGAMGLWVTQIVNGVIVLGLLVGYAAIKKKRFPRSLADFLALPDNFGVPDSQRLDLTITSSDDVVNTSKAVIDFCAAHDVNRRQSFIAGLCLEEMVGNVVAYGFGIKKRHSADVRVVYTPEELTLRISDDCRPFDPQARAELTSGGEDAARNIGIRLVHSLANEMSYQCILGLNVLTIKVIPTQ